MITNRKFSWTAVIVAAFVGVGLNFLLNLFSLSIGLSVFAENVKGLITFSWFGFLGFVLVAIISMFTTGYIAGLLAPEDLTQKKCGILYGFVAWSICFVMTVVLITNMIQFAYFHSDFTSNQLVTIKITNEFPMLTETKTGNASLEMKTITLNAYVTFILFLIGAISSCVGGYISFQRHKGQI